MKHGKNYRNAAEKIEAGKLYEVNDALALAIETATAKFDETIEIHVRLGVDPRSADQQVRGSVVLPNGTGKTQKVLVIAKGDKEAILSDITLMDKGVLIPQVAILGNILKQKGFPISKIPVTEKQAVEVFSAALKGGNA